MKYTEKVYLTRSPMRTNVKSSPKGLSAAIDYRYWGGQPTPTLRGAATFSDPPPLSRPESMPENCCKSDQIRAPNRFQNHFKTTSQEVLQTQCKSGSPFAGTMHEESPWTLSLDCSEPIETTVFYSSFRHLAMFTCDSHNSPHWHENLC